MTLKSLVFLMAFIWTAFAHAQGLHVVFDLDGTLIESLDPQVSHSETDEQILKFKDHTYRIVDFAPEVIVKLRDAGYKISFFSGGPADRNHAVIERLQRMILERTGQEFTPYKVLSSTDLTPILGRPENALTRDRFRKDLQKVAFPEDVVLIDDIKQLVMQGQERSLIEIDGGFATVRQQQKLLVAMEILLEARDLLNRAPVQFLQAVRGLAHGTAPGPGFDDEVFKEFMSKGLNRFGLDLSLRERSYPKLRLPRMCSRLYF